MKRKKKNWYKKWAKNRYWFGVPWHRGRRDVLCLTSVRLRPDFNCTLPAVSVVRSDSWLLVSRYGSTRSRTMVNLFDFSADCQLVSPHSSHGRHSSMLCFRGRPPGISWPPFSNRYIPSRELTILTRRRKSWISPWSRPSALSANFYWRLSAAIGKRSVVCYGRAWQRPWPCYVRNTIKLCLISLPTYDRLTPPSLSLRNQIHSLRLEDCWIFIAMVRNVPISHRRSEYKRPYFLPFGCPSKVIFGLAVKELPWNNP